MTCPECEGRGLIIIDENGFNSITNCLTCDGKGWVLTEDETYEEPV